MTFQEVEEFIKNNPTRANALAKAASQASPSDPITQELELGREILTVRSLLANSSQIQKEPENAKPGSSQVPGFLAGMAFTPFAFKKDKTEIMENDKDYNKLRKQKLDEYKKEWEKNNPGKKFYSSKESVDFIHGSLENDNSPSLRKEAEKDFREKYQKKAQKYDKRALNSKRNPNRDIAVSYSGSEIEREIALRKALFAKENPSLQVKDLNEEGKRIEERVRQKRWEEFVKKYPQKAKAYEKSHKEINAAISRINAPKITGEESLDDTLREYYKKEWKERQTPREEKKEPQGFGGVPKIGDEKLDNELRSFYRTPSEPVHRPVEQTPSSQRFQRPGFKNIRLPGRGGSIDRINRLVHRGKGMKQGTKVAKQAAKKAMSQAGKMALKNPYVLAAVIGIMLLILIIFGLFFFFSSGTPPTSIAPTLSPTPIPSGPPIPGFKIEKTGPLVVNNGENIKYIIEINYSGAEDVTIIDAIPKPEEDTTFVSATGNYKKEPAQGPATNIIWFLKENLPFTDIGGIKTYFFDLVVKPLKQDFSVTNNVIAIQDFISGSSDLINILPNTEQTALTIQRQTDVAMLLKRADISPNIQVYQEAASITGIAWEILAGIHYREGSMSPNKSLASGTPIGQIEPNVPYCEPVYQKGEPIRRGGGCIFLNLLDSAIYAGNHLKNKIGGNVPQTIEDLSEALSYYNGGGNANCGKIKTPYIGCPKLYTGEDDTYVMSLYDKKHEAMYIIYCTDGGVCPPPLPRDSRPGVLSATMGIVRYYNQL